MIKILEKFNDKKVAVGFLARAALALEGVDNPEAKAVLDNEVSIRETLLAEAREYLGLQENDNRIEAIEKLRDFLDHESDKIIGTPDTTSALVRLAEEGNLPSDLYRVRIIENIAKFHGKNFDLERQLIEAAIRAPNQEQHFGPPKNPDEPALISLFARYFKTQFPYKDFIMLVAGQRDRFILNVHQAWRIYPSILNIGGVSNLVDLLHRFADEYGSDVEMGGRKGHFFLMLDEPLPSSDIKLEMSHGKRKTITFSHFLQANLQTGQQTAALVVAIDLGKYHATLDKMRLKPEEIKQLVSS